MRKKTNKQIDVTKKIRKHVALNVWIVESLTVKRVKAGEQNAQRLDLTRDNLAHSAKVVRATPLSPPSVESAVGLDLGGRVLRSMNGELEPNHGAFASVHVVASTGL